MILPLPGKSIPPIPNPLPVTRGGTGVQSLSDILPTTNQVSVSGGTARVVGGDVTLSLPQNIHTAATPQFARLGLGVAASATIPLTALSSSNPQLRLSHTAASKYWEAQVDTDHDLLWKGSSTGGIRFQPTTDSTDFLQVLDSNGGTPILNVDATNECVGFGTAAPAHKIHVVSSQNNKNILLDNTYSGSGIADVLILQGASNTTRAKLENSKAAGVAKLELSTPDAGVVQIAHGNNDRFEIGTASAASGGIYFYSPVGGFTIADSQGDHLKVIGGDVGIGTMSPDRRLDVLDASNPQLRLSHTAASKYADFQVDTNHHLTITPSGSGTVTFSSAVKVANGTAASPSLSFSNDSDTGLYRTASNHVQIACGGSQVAYFNASQFRPIVPIRGEPESAAAPTYSFQDDNDTGVYRVGANILGFSTGGVKRAEINSSGLLYVDGVFGIKDGVTAPATSSGKALMYVDSADGDLKVKFGDGTVKTIVTDT